MTDRDMLSKTVFRQIIQSTSFSWLVTPALLLAHDVA